MRQTWIPVTIYNLFVAGTKIMFSSLGYIIFIFRFAKDAFLSIIFLVINIHLGNGTNFDARNNLYSYSYGHYNHVLPIEVKDIDALDLQEKLFFPPLSL